jgi:hypothetical protein
MKSEEKEKRNRSYPRADHRRQLSHHQRALFFSNQHPSRQSFPLSGSTPAVTLVEEGKKKRNERHQSESVRGYHMYVAVGMKEKILFIF